MAVPLLMQQSINYNLAVEKDQQELLVPPRSTGVMRVVLEPSVPGEFAVGVRSRVENRERFECSTF